MVLLKTMLKKENNLSKYLSIFQKFDKFIFIIFNLNKK
jgi:hypothetical protein